MASWLHFVCRIPAVPARRLSIFDARYTLNSGSMIFYYRIIPKLFSQSAGHFPRPNITNSNSDLLFLLRRHRRKLFKIKLDGLCFIFKLEIVWSSVLNVKLLNSIQLLFHSGSPSVDGFTSLVQNLKTHDKTCDHTKSCSHKNLIRDSSQSRRVATILDSYVTKKARIHDTS